MEVVESDCSHPSSPLASLHIAPFSHRGDCGTTCRGRDVIRLIDVARTLAVVAEFRIVEVFRHHLCAEKIIPGLTHFLFPVPPPLATHPPSALASLRQGVDAVWPGWGHASENPQLPTRLTAEGIKFIGPTAPVMAVLGDKIAANILAQTAKVPSIPWSGDGLEAVLTDVSGVRFGGWVWRGSGSLAILISSLLILV